MKKICNLKDISIYLNMSESTIRKFVREKRIPYFRIGYRIKFNLEKIDEWLEELSEKEFKNSIFL